VGAGSVLAVDRAPAAAASSVDRAPVVASSSPRGSRLDLSRLHFELPRFSGGSAKTPAAATGAKSEARKRAKARERKAARTLAVITGKRRRNDYQINQIKYDFNNG